MSDEWWVMSDEWWVMEIEWRKLSDENSLPKQALKLSINLPLSHSVLLSHHSHFLNHPLTLTISLSAQSNSPTRSQSPSQSRSRSRSPSQSRSHSVLSLSVCIFSLESQGMSPYLNICLSIGNGGLGLFVGICGYLWCNFWIFFLMNIFMCY